MIDVCADTSYNFENPILKRSNFVQLMRLATEFSFNITLYCQNDSGPTVSPLKPTLAKIFMGYLEYETQPQFNSKCK